MKMLSVKEYAILKGMAESTVYKAVRENRVKFEKIGNHILILTE